MRKALIIGLGGTGVRICNEIAERIRWEFGERDRVRFVEVLGIDTARDTVTGTTLDNANDFVHLRVPPASFEQMRSNPTSFDSQMRLSEWVNHGVLNVQNAVEDGTQGLRMLGRISLLIQENFRQIDAKIRQKLHSLVTLTETDARDALGRRLDGTATDVRFTPTVRAYVVGTCCGGTGSGTWIDLGYLLRWIGPQVGGSINTEGILTLPPQSEADTRKKANTYATLIELNHFSTDGNEFWVKYPIVPDLVRLHARPYDNPCLVTVDLSRADQGGLRTYEELNRTLAQYIYSDVFYNVGDQRDGRRNDISAFFISKDLRGHTQRFMTFGLSFLQYPLERVLKGCSYKLLTETAERWLEDHSGAGSGAVTAPISADPAALARRLWQIEPNTLLDRINTLIADVETDYHGVRDLEYLRYRISQGFGENPPQDADARFPHNIVPSTLQANVGPTRDEVNDRLRQFVTDALCDLQRGPSYARAYLTALGQFIDNRAAAPAPPVPEDTTSLLLKRLLDVNQDPLLRLTHPFRGFVERDIVQHYWGTARAYYEARLSAAAVPYEQQVWRELRPRVSMLLARVEALEQYLTHAREAFRRHWAEQDRPFPINGTLLFDSGSLDADDDVRERATITREYNRLIEHYPDFVGLSFQEAQAQARQRVVSAARAFIASDGTRSDDLFADPGRSFFDRDASQPEGRDKYSRLRGQDEGVLITASRAFFAAAANTDVVAAFMARHSETEARAELRKVDGLSRPFLSLNLNDPDYLDHPRKAKRWVFYAGARVQNPSGALAEFKELVAEVCGVDPTGDEVIVADLNDRTLAIFVSDRGAFPLRLVGGLDDFRQYYEAWMRGDASILGAGARQQVPTLFARDDVAWLSFSEVDREKLLQAEEIFVAGLATELIQRAGDTVGFTYQPRATPEVRNPRAVRFERDLRQSVRRVYDDPLVFGSLRTELHHLHRPTAPNDPEAGGANGARTGKPFIKRLFNDFLDGNRWRVLGLAGIPGENADVQRQYLEGVLRRFIDRSPDLREIYRELFPPNLDYSYLKHAASEPINRSDPSQGHYPTDGYYCERCHLLFGSTEDRVKSTCPSCGYIYR